MVKKKEVESKEYAIKVKGLSKVYKNNNKKQKTVFNDFNINFEKGKVHCILGVSGCGKSTLLRAIADLEEYDTGEILFDKSINKRNDIFLSMVFQDNNLLPWNTVSENLEFVLKSTRKKVADGAIDNILKKHNLQEYKDFYPFELSGGLKQKVALAKAIITKPSIVLLDEPFCSLDFVSKAKIHDVFLEEFSEEKFTSILSTHYIEEAIKLGDYIHLLGKDGVYKKFDNPLKKPRNEDKGFKEFIDFITQEYV